MAVQITTGSSTAGKANVTSNYALEVHTPTTEANAGFVQISSENDSGSATLSRFVLSPETDDDYRLRISTDSIWDAETFNYTGVNSFKYKVQNTGFTQAYGSGFLSLNSTGVTTASQAACLTTWKYFPVFGADQTYAEFALTNSASMTSGVTIDAGFFVPGSTPYAPTDGAYIRVTSAGVYGIINYNGVETSVGPFKATDGVTNLAFSANVIYHCVVSVNERSVRFWIDDVLRGTYDVDATGNGQCFMMGSQPFSFRQANSGTGAGGAISAKIADYTIAKGGYDPARNWQTSQAAMGHSGYTVTAGGTMGSTAQYANSANPTAAVPTNTTAALATGLGGQFWETDTLAVTTDGIVQSYQVPTSTANITGRCLLVYGVKIASHVQTALTGGGYVASWSLAFGGSTVSLAATESATVKLARRVALGFQSVASGATALTVLSEINCRFDCPIAVNPGEFIQCVKKKIGTAPTAGVIAHLITFDCVWE